MLKITTECHTGTSWLTHCVTDTAGRGPVCARLCLRALPERHVVGGGGGGVVRWRKKNSAIPIKYFLQRINNNTNLYKNNGVECGKNVHIKRGKFWKILINFSSAKIWQFKTFKKIFQIKGGRYFLIGFNLLPGIWKHWWVCFYFVCPDWEKRNAVKLRLEGNLAVV